MRSANLRRSVAAVTLTLSGAVLAAGAAHAAPITTIGLEPSEVAFVDEPMTAFGSCIDGSRTAVVTVVQDEGVVAQEAVTLDADLSYSVDLDLTDGALGMATVTADCFRYADADPLDSTEESFYLSAGPDFDEVSVTVSPARVTIGTSFTITGECAPGTSTATVLAGSGDNEDVFLEEDVTPAADGTVTFTSVLTAGPLVDPGDAGALVFCGTDDEPTGFGFADFTILAAPPAHPAPPASVVPASVVPASVVPASVVPASVVPALAYTGSDSGPLTAISGGLVLLGAGVYRIRRWVR